MLLELGNWHGMFVPLMSWLNVVPLSLTALTASELFRLGLEVRHTSRLFFFFFFFLKWSILFPLYLEIWPSTFSKDPKMHNFSPRIIFVLQILYLKFASPSSHVTSSSKARTQVEMVDLVNYISMSLADLNLCLSGCSLGNCGLNSKTAL